jgi:hypothetical protein
MKLTKSKLKQVIMEGLFDTDAEDMNSKLIDRFDKLLDGIESLDLSVDYLSAVMTGTSPLSIQTGQKALGRFAKPATRGPATGIKEDASDISPWKVQLEEAITSLYGAGYKAEEIREMVEGAFNTELKEVSSEKQRKWACAQMGDDFKGKRKLTKKQAKEMCKSKVEK